MSKIIVHTSNNGGVKVDPFYFSDITISPQRNIEVMYNYIKEKLFQEKLNYGILTSKEVDDLMQIFNGSYGLVKAKFQYIERNTGGRYFNHLIRVTYKMLIESFTPTFEKTLISINHDIIEDTDITFQSLKDILSLEKVAFGVLIISKKPFGDFINNIKDYGIFNEIKRSGILNSKGFLSDYFLVTLKNNPSLITDEKEYFHKQYKKLFEKYKEKKNEFFFSHMLDFNTFYNNALKLKIDYYVNLNDDEIREIALEALEVKYWDRIDNLETSEIYTIYNKKTIKKAKRKLKETEKYFYNISQETHPNIFILIKSEVEKLRAYIVSGEISNNSDLINQIIKSK